MKRLKPITVASLITGLLGVPLPDLADDKADKRTPKPHLLTKALRGAIRAATELPDDPALPGLVAIREACLVTTNVFPNPGGSPVELSLRGYSPGSRATVEARVGRHRIAVKAYADDPAREAALYRALAAAELAGASGVRVPPLLAWERNLKMLVIGWLEGPTAQQLVEDRQGERAGRLAACWLQRAASLRVKLGRPFGAARMLQRAYKWVAALGAADRALGTSATALVGRLARTQPKEGAPRLVHGTLYARHVLDLGEGPGVIDWQRFGQGPPELDAGMFLATVWRLGLRLESLAGEAFRAEKAFRAGTADLLDERTLAWHRAAALLRLADRLLKRRQGDWLAEAHALLNQAARLAENVR